MQKSSKFSPLARAWWKRFGTVCTEWLLFGQEIVKSPVHIGAICPSSKYLSRSIARQIPFPKENEYIVELGAGTGRITQEILRLGCPPQNLILIERSSKLCELLKARFKNCQVINGDASNLLALLGKQQHQVKAVISSLPLVSLPPLTVKMISEQINLLPCKNVLLVQFTYQLMAKVHPHLSSPRLQKIYSQHVWRNLPPARLDVYTLKN